MYTEEKIKNFEESVNKMYFDKSSLNDCRPFLKDEWEKLKKDEDALALATSINEEDSISSQIISSLVLMDYDNIDELIYETLINNIYNKPEIALLPNLFTNSKYPFITTSLFNPNLSLNDKQASFLLDLVLSDYNNIKPHLRSLEKIDVYFHTEQREREYYKSEIIKKISELKTLLNKRDNNPLFINKPQDIRYFILTHRIIGKREEFNLNDLYFSHLKQRVNINNKTINIDELVGYLKRMGRGYNSEFTKFYTEFINNEIETYNNYQSLLQNPIERVKIRKITRMPF